MQSSIVWIRFVGNDCSVIKQFKILASLYCGFLKVSEPECMNLLQFVSKMISVDNRPVEGSTASASEEPAITPSKQCFVVSVPIYLFIYLFLIL